MKIISRASQELMLWSCQQMKLSLPSLEPILPFQSIVLTISSSEVWNDGPIFHPWLWIDSKNRLYCCELSPNTQLKNHFIVVNEGADPLRIEFTIARLWYWLNWDFSNKSILSHNDDQFFPCLQIHWKRPLLIAVKQILNNVASSNF